MQGVLEMSECSLDAVWHAVLQRLSRKLSEDQWQRWFSGIRLVEDDGTRLVLEVPNHMWQFWIESNLAKELEEAVVEALGTPRGIAFRCNGNAPVPRVQQTTSRRVVKSPAPETSGGLSPELVRRAGLNPRYTFDAFVVGAANQYAAAAARAVAERPGQAYNPLFLYGGSGLGKTHLMQAIGLEVLRLHPKARVVCITAEHYTNAFIDGIRQNDLTQFRARFRTADVLLIDDVYFFAGKEGTQDELHFTFNDLMADRKQIVLTCDRPAGEVKSLHNRLKTRFQWGLTVELAPPDKETRIAILLKKLSEMQFTVPDEVVEFLAEHIRESVRDLEGCLHRLRGLCSLSNGGAEQAVTLDSAVLVVGDLLGQDSLKPLEIRHVQTRTAEHYQISFDDLLSSRRTAKLAEARHVAMYLCRRECRDSLKEIGAAFKRDHSTVIHACRAIEKKLKSSRELQNTVQRIQSSLRR
jgi:chromosomal replication initiator protein